MGLGTRLKEETFKQGRSNFCTDRTVLTRRYPSTNTRYTEIQKITTRMDERPPPLTYPRRRQKENRPTGISGKTTPGER